MRDTLVRLSEERIAILISKLPDKEARDELVVGHLRLGKYLVGRVRRQYGGDSGDLLGAATLTLIKCVDRLASGDKVLSDGNISRWLTIEMIGAMRAEICNSALVRIPKATLLRHVAAGSRMGMTRLDLTDAVLGSVSNPKRYEDQDRAEMERLDRVKSILKTDLEHKVFDLRYQGLSDTEIGDLIGMNPRSVFRIREDIGKRFMESENNGE